MPGIGIINNPHSRQNRKNPQGMESLGYIVGSQGQAAATRDIDDIHQMARLFKSEGIEVLGINGGDGSNHVTITAFIEEYGDEPLPKIAFLRGGTMNIAANSCGVRGTPAGLMMNLTRKVREGIPLQTTFRDTVCIESHYGFIFGCGFVYTFLSAFYERGKKNAVQAARLVGRLVGSALVRGKFYRSLTARLDCRVSVDGRPWPHDGYYALAASTVEQIGLGFKAFHRHEEKPGTFHLLGLIRPPASLVVSIPKVYTGRRVSTRKLVETVAARAVIEAAEPVPYTLDGENYPGSTRLEITCGPRLEIVVS